MYRPSRLPASLSTQELVCVAKKKEEKREEKKKRRRTAHLVAAAGACLVSYKYAVVLIASIAAELFDSAGKVINKEMLVPEVQIGPTMAVEVSCAVPAAVIISGFYHCWNLTQR